MYTEKEILSIFSSVKSLDELYKVAGLFMWLVEEGYLKKSKVLYLASHVAFRRVI